MADNSSHKKTRSPVVAVMGHVDHGKTTLLDFIRKTNVAAREAGGITQSVGAYEIEHAGKRITFIDTPGHEAFLAMRARGANIADLAILVVAADEGPKPQTIESVKIIQETKTPFVVAVTKSDKSNANVEKVKQDLASAGVLLEGYGGQVPWHLVSAKTGEGVSELLDLVLLAAELEELSYDPSLPAEGIVLEARRDNRRGNEVTAIIMNGTLRTGDEISTATARGKVKILENFLGESASELTPSAPALIVGFETLPRTGERFTAGPADPTAPRPSDAPTSSIDKKHLSPVTATENALALRLILKAENAGALEAMSHIIRNASFDRPVDIASSGVGDVIDNDVKLAISTGALIVAFGNRIDRAARTLAEANGVTIIASNVIYHLVTALQELLVKELTAASGALEVLAIFSQTKLDKQVVGGKVVEGVFKNRAQFDIERTGAAAGHGRVANLQQQKKDAHQVAAGNECGALVGADIAIQKGDKLIIR